VLPEVKAGDEVVANGMSAKGVLRFRIPPVALTAHVRLGDEEFELPLRLDTIGVLAEESRAALTLRTSFRYLLVKEQLRETTLVLSAPEVPR